MGIIVSLLVIAVGAIMRFAVTVQGHGFNVRTTGVILIVIGIIGAIVSIVYWASWGGFTHNRISRRTTVISAQAPVANVTNTKTPPTMSERQVVEHRDIQ